MSLLKIQDYPDAYFCKKKRFGYLMNYFPVKKGKEWKTTRSYIVLNYKENKKGAIQRFVDPFFDLLSYSMEELNFQKAILCPIPCSKPKKDIDNKGMYQKNKRANYAYRNNKFCELISRKDSVNIQVHGFIERIKSKEKGWTKQDHKESFKFNKDQLKDDKPLIVLVDDVYTNGHTTQGAQMKIKENLNHAQFITLVIGKTKRDTNSV